VIASAIAAATAFSCRPEPGLGSVALARHGSLHVVDLASCRDRVVGRGGEGRVVFRPDGRPHVVPFRGLERVVTPDGAMSAEVRSSGAGKSAKQTIWVTNTGTHKSHPVFSETQSYKTIGPGETPGPIMLLGISDDYNWVFFMIDPGGSASIAADGLTLRVVSTASSRPVRIARMLPYRDYLAWCGRTLVITAGGWRVATDRKRLLVASPPDWRPRPLVTKPNRSWGSLACAPGRPWLVAQSQRQSDNPNFFATHWALWRVGLDGSTRRLTSPPRGFADESPRFSRTGSTLLFVRSRKGSGRLYALRGARQAGPLLSLGNSLGYYGHQNWWFSADWSAGR
jgi:hypothetical protein